MHLGTRALTLTIDGVERTADVSECWIIQTPGLRYWGRGGGSTRCNYSLRATAAQDMTPGSLWSLAWDYADEIVAVDLRPAGGATATEEQPWFTGHIQLVPNEGPILGGQANPSNSAKLTFTFEWPFLGKPVRVDGVSSW